MYYYLNETKEVQGPFTAEQMRRLLEEGTITPHTLASEAGGSGWQELATLNLADPAVPAGEPLGPCPHCGNMLTGDGVPPVCPHCGKGLHPGTENLWQNAWYAFMQYATFRGRATRREFWSFMLFRILAQVVLMLAAIYFTSMVMETKEAWESLMSGINGLLTLVFFLPTLAVTVRRLHDTGHSGWWAAAPYGCILLMIPLLILGVAMGDSGMALALLFIIAFQLAALCICFYVFIQTLMPSHHGPNKHGPSLLFPSKIVNRQL